MRDRCPAFSGDKMRRPGTFAEPQARSSGEGWEDRAKSNRFKSARWETSMPSKITTVLNQTLALSARPRCLLLGGLAALACWALDAPPAHAQASAAQITVLYDAFGKTSTM